MKVDYVKTDYTEAKYGPMSSGGSDPGPNTAALEASSTKLATSAQLLLAQISARIEKTNELLELILTVLDEKGSKAVVPPPVQQKFANVQNLIFEDMKQHGGGMASEIAKRMNMPENSIGPGLYRLWHKGKVSLERVPGERGPVSYYKIK